MTVVYIIWGIVAVAAAFDIYILFLLARDMYVNKYYRSLMNDISKLLGNYGDRLDTVDKNYLTNLQLPANYRSLKLIVRQVKKIQNTVMNGGKKNDRRNK